MRVSGELEFLGLCKHLCWTVGSEGCLASPVCHQILYMGSASLEYNMEHLCPGAELTVERAVS